MSTVNAIGNRITEEVFKATVEEYCFKQRKPSLKKDGTYTKPPKTIGPCPVEKPVWLSELEKDGIELDLNEVKAYAGYHFIGSLVPDDIPGNSDYRTKAGELSTMIMSMSKAKVYKSKKLWFKKNIDADIHRWNSELFGIGAGIALLAKKGVIDVNTIQKISDRFDFKAKKDSNKSFIRLEFKGISGMGNISATQNSIEKKIKDVVKVRTYDQAIGVIFIAWRRGEGKKRKVDFQIMDPGDTKPEDKNITLKQKIIYYAKFYDRYIKIPEAAKRLYELSVIPNLISKSDLSHIISQNTRPGMFSRTKVSFKLHSSEKQTYWGAFIDANYFPSLDISVNGKKPKEFIFAYAGIRDQLILLLKQNNFEEFIEFQIDSIGSFEFQYLFEDIEYYGIGIALSDGTIRLWANHIFDINIAINE